MRVRVRFAPSPTGYLHLGGARTALFNFLFARSQKGVFILRIEDTDQERSKKEYEEDIIESLSWLKLNWDEGPIKQSERLDLYQRVIELLLEKKFAYYCFCPKEELEIRRQEQISRGEVPKYPGTCRNLSPEEIKKKISQGLPYVIRLKVPERKIKFRDYFRGEIPYDFRTLGDFVIARNERDPLYLLATPVDDHYQGITHIIRGEDHLPNTPKQLLIYQYLEWPEPIFAHLPLILGQDRTKMSKRHGSMSIREYRNQGYLPEAILNFLVLLGWHPAGDREIISLDEMIKQFSLDKVQKRPAIFSSEKLIYFNKYYLRLKNNQDLIELISFKDYGYWQNNKFYAKNNVVYSQEKILKIIDLGKERAETLNDILSSVSFFFDNFDYSSNLLLWNKCSASEIKDILVKLKGKLMTLKEFNETEVKKVLEEIVVENNLTNRGYVYWPMRVALSGREFSPPPFTLAEIFGKEKTLELIDKAINKL